MPAAEAFPHFILKYSTGSEVMWQIFFFSFVDFVKMGGMKKSLCDLATFNGVT